MITRDGQNVTKVKTLSEMVTTITIMTIMMLNYYDDNFLQEWGCGPCHWKAGGWDQPGRNPGKVDFHNFIADYWTF